MLNNRIQEIVEETAKKQEQKRQEMFIDDVLDIYKGFYKNYETYNKVYNKRIEYIKEMKEKDYDNMLRKVQDGIYLFSQHLYIEPCFIGKDIFDYIITRRVDDRTN